MALNIFGVDEEESRTHVLVSVAAEIFLVSAVVLLVFAYLRLTPEISTIVALAPMFLGSLVIWKNYNGAKLVLLFSLIAVQLVVIKYADILMLPFGILDVIIAALIISSWKSQDE